MFLRWLCLLPRVADAHGAPSAELAFAYTGAVECVPRGEPPACASPVAHVGEGFTTVRVVSEAGDRVHSATP